MDLVYGSIYCHICKDYVYDNEFESICRKLKKKSAKFLGTVNYQYFPWEPTLNELEILKQNPGRKRVSENSFIGECDAPLPVIHGLCARSRQDKR